MKTNKIIISLLIFLVLMCITNCVSATTISFDNNSPKVGDSVKITVTVPNVHTASVYANVSGAGTSGQIKVVGGDMMGNKTTLSNYMTVTPTSTGTITVTIAENSSAVADGTYVNVAASNSISVIDSTPVAPAPEPTTPTPEPTTPKEPEKPAEPVVSSNANLRNLVVQPVDFTGFRSSKTTGYTVTVENDVTKVTVIPTLADSKSSYEITGHTNLKEGTNIVKVLVTAEDGTKKTYQVNVIRKVAATEVTPNSVEDTADSTGVQNTIGLSKLEVKGFSLSSEFASNTYRYIIELDDEEILTLEQVKKLISAEVNFEGGTFEITGEDELNKEENEVIISVKDVDGREIAIYTLVFKYPQVEDTADTADVSDTSISVIDIAKPIEIDIDKLVILLSITIITIIALISTVNLYRQRKILQENGLIKEKEYYEDETNEENI